MAGKVVLVLGAGATVGAKFRMVINGWPSYAPMDKNFFSSEVVKAVFKEDKYPALHFYHHQRLSDNVGLEELWGRVDLYLKLCISRVICEESSYQILGESMDRKASSDGSYRIKMEQEKRRSRVPSMAAWELISLVREVFSYLQPPNPDDSPLKELIDPLLRENLLAGVVSFNYDTSLEQLFPNQFYYPLLSNETTHGRLPLMKLHGSLNWQFDSRNGKAPIPAVESIARMQHFTDGYMQPDVVGPSFFKQEITVETQQDARGSYYKRLWRYAWDTLQTADHLIFIGFSFPPTDFHAAALFRTAALSGNAYKNVVFCHFRDANIYNKMKDIFHPVGLTEYDQGLEVMAGHMDRLLNVITRH